MTKAKNLWGGRFTGAADPTFVAFNKSLVFDCRLIEVDVRASVAHCHALRDAEVLTADEATLIENRLCQVLNDTLTNPDALILSEAEDVHSFVEGQLVALIGDVGRKLHTGRSRNDQVATDLRLWVREALDHLLDRARATQAALLDLAEENQDAVLPGYTHLQRAQPVLFAHWCLAYFEMLDRDCERLIHNRTRASVLPLGSGALAGTSYRIDRDAVARELGFESISHNSLDAVSDRDFCVEFIASCSLVMVHLSRLAEDIILYATSEFGFFELSDAVATGSSLMPQKKNPDSMELVRGKAARVFGHNMTLLTMLKGLPLAYNKDMQEDKEAVFDAFDTTGTCLEVTSLVLGNISLKRERMLEAATHGYLNATELADYLVRKGMPFREAHDAVGRIVVRAIESRVELQDLPLDEMRSISGLIDDDVAAALSLDDTLATKSQIGGTSPQRVREALVQARSRLRQ